MREDELRLASRPLDPLGAAPVDISTPADAVAPPPLRVGICIATCQRPEMLENLLRSISLLEFPSVASPHLQIILIDNSVGAEGRQVADAAHTYLKWPLRYEVEPVRSISLSRNRAIEHALACGLDAVAFIDDDEVVDPLWLDELLRVQAMSMADIVAGPVIPHFESGIPAWLKEAGFFDLPRHPTGAEVDMAFTGNVLIGIDWVRGPLPPFDPAFGKTGGEDSHYFMRARRAGARIVWADEAIVQEHVPASRGNVQWILYRAFRVGSQSVHCERSLMPLRRWLLPRLLKATGRTLQGALLLIPSIILGRAAAVAALRRVAHGFGCFSGILGIRPREYEVTHGR